MLAALFPRHRTPLTSSLTVAVCDTQYFLPSVPRFLSSRVALYFIWLVVLLSLTMHCTFCITPPNPLSSVTLSMYTVPLSYLQMIFCPLKAYNPITEKAKFNMERPFCIYVTCIKIYEMCCKRFHYKPRRAV